MDQVLEPCKPCKWLHFLLAALVVGIFILRRKSWLPISDQHLLRHSVLHVRFSLHNPIELIEFDA